MFKLKTAISCTQGCPGFGPIVDGDGGFLPKMPFQMRMDDTYKDSYKNIPVMLGVNTDESSIFLFAGTYKLIRFHIVT